MRCRNVAAGAAGGSTVRILWVSPFLPHPKARHAGGRGEYGWMAALAERHDITLVARMEPAERDAAIALRPGCRASHADLRAPDGPLAAAAIVGSYVRLGRMAQRIQDAGDFDVVHVEWLETGLGMRRTSDVGRVNVAIDELTKPARRRAGLAEGGPRDCAASSACGRSPCSSTASARSSTSSSRSPSRTATRSARRSPTPTCVPPVPRRRRRRRSSRARPETTTTCCSSAR